MHDRHVLSAACADTTQFVLPKLPSPPHPARPNSKTGSSSAAAALTIVLKPMKKEHPTVSLPSIIASTTSVYDLKAAYASRADVSAAKIKILYKKKPVPDSKTVIEVVGNDVEGEIEFGIMVLGGGVVASPAPPSPAQSPPASAPKEDDKDSQNQPTGSAAQGPSGKEVVNEEFWSDLKGFVVQRIRDEGEGERLVRVFKSAWEKEQ